MQTTQTLMVNITKISAVEYHVFADPADKIKIEKQGQEWFLSDEQSGKVFLRVHMIDPDHSIKKAIEIIVSNLTITL